MTPGILLYRCRRCNALDSSVHAPDIDYAVDCIISGHKAPREWGGRLPPLVDMHTCSDGAAGVTDLIGGAPDKPVEIGDL
jgi:hypothetical protein